MCIAFTPSKGAGHETTYFRLLVASFPVHNRIVMDDRTLSLNWPSGSTGNSRNTYIFLGIILPLLLAVIAWIVVAAITFFIPVYFCCARRKRKSPEEEEAADYEACYDCSTACLKECCCKWWSIACCKACCCKPSKACWRSYW